jgi:hypothetical protein
MRLSLPEGTLSPHLNPYERPFPTTEYARWLHLAGHFGWRFRQMLPDFDARPTATVVREPVARVVSCYTYWRFNVPPPYAAHVARARELAFSDFVRSPDLDSNLFEDQTAFLGGDLYCSDPFRQAEDLLRPYKIVGTTDNLGPFLDRVLRALNCESSVSASALLASVPSNASLGCIEISDEDRSYVAARQPLDAALYSTALRRSLSG